VWFNEAMRHVLDDKERQLESLRTREASLVEECQRHQETIRRLTDADTGSQGYELIIFVQKWLVKGWSSLYSNGPINF
jgi:hypothetical protein